MIELQLVRFKGEWPDREPENPKLFSLLEEFWEREFPGTKKIEFKYLTHIWVVVEDDGDAPKVIGAMGATYLPDIPWFHSHSHKAYALMFRKLQSWTLENGIPLLSVFIQPENVEKVKAFMERCAAEPAERWLFKSTPDIEVK